MGALFIGVIPKSLECIAVRGLGMVTPTPALCLHGVRVGGVIIPSVGVAPRRWYRCCSTNGRCAPKIPAAALSTDAQLGGTDLIDLLWEELVDASDSQYLRKQLAMAFQREIWEEEYWEYPSRIHVRSKLHYFLLIKDRLNEARCTLFHTTCFGPWLDLTYVENDDGMIHYILQKKCCTDDDSFDLPLIYSVNVHSLHFGRREFCLITGFKFGSLSFCEYRNGDILFRNQLFPEKIGYDVKITDVLALIEDEEKFSKVSDEDAIRLCLLLSLEVIFIGRELVSVVDDIFLRMVDNLDAWNSFPWGEHIWRQLYDAIRNVSSKHKLEHLDGLRKNRNYVPSYLLSGFHFAFKIWIIESSCESERWWNKVPGNHPESIVMDEKS
ncbi:phospholipase-like, aminotransferase-like mobile domain protein [Tanacetum coccineum]